MESRNLAEDWVVRMPCSELGSQWPPICSKARELSVRVTGTSSSQVLVLVLPSRTATRPAGAKDAIRLGRISEITCTDERTPPPGNGMARGRNEPLPDEQPGLVRARRPAASRTSAFPRYSTCHTVASSTRAGHGGTPSRTCSATVKGRSSRVIDLDGTDDAGHTYSTADAVLEHGTEQKRMQLQIVSQIQCDPSDRFLRRRDV